MRTEVFIGIDISKRRLDVFNLATGEALEFENTPAGIQAFVKYAKQSKPTLMVCESTGGLEQPLLLGCTEVKLPLAVVNPRQVRDFSRALGKYAKTDAIDAEMLSEFASRMRPEITVPSPEELRALSWTERHVLSRTAPTGPDCLAGLSARGYRDSPHPDSRDVDDGTQSSG